MGIPIPVKNNMLWSMFRLNGIEDSRLSRN